MVTKFAQQLQDHEFLSLSLVKKIKSIYSSKIGIIMKIDNVLPYEVLYNVYLVKSWVVYEKW